MASKWLGERDTKLDVMSIGLLLLLLLLLSDDVEEVEVEEGEGISRVEPWYLKIIYKLVHPKFYLKSVRVLRMTEMGLSGGLTLITSR